VEEVVRARAVGSVIATEAELLVHPLKSETVRE
jgi:hypothetical protein